MNGIALNRFNYLALPEKSTDTESVTVPGTHPASLDVTWETLTDAFLADFRGATRRTYRDSWNLFMDFCRIDTREPATRIPDEDFVRAFRDTLLDSSHSPNTINAYLAAIRAFYRFLHGYVRKAFRTGQITAYRAGELQLLIEGVLSVRKVRTSSAPGRLPTTVDQSRDLLDSIPAESDVDIRDRAMIALLIGCGLRRIEVVRALRGDLIHQGGQLLLKVQQKGHHDKNAWVVIMPGVERMLRPWLNMSPCSKPDEPLFCSLSRRDKGTPLTPRSVSQIVRKRLDTIGLSDYSTHSLRHAFATIALSSDDVELRDVQHALGHSQVTTTERYAHQMDRLSGKPEKAVNDRVFDPPDKET